MAEFDINVNVNGAKSANDLNTKLQDLDKHSKKSTTSLTDLAKKTAVLTGSVYALNKAYDATLAVGFNFNKSMEQNIQGLTALTVATSKNVDSMGNALNIQEKYTLANVEATKTLKALQAVNVDTPHTLDETNKIYKAMYVSMKNAGASTDDMVQLTKQVSIAAGSAEIEFQGLLAGVDGLATGTVLANSDLGRFLTGLGLTNEELKNSENVVGLLNDRLSQFQPADTMERAISNLTNAWEQLNGELTKGLFDSTKDSFNDLADAINENKDDIVLYGDFAGATLSRMGDGFNLLFETASAGFTGLTSGTEIAFKTMVKALADSLIGISGALESIGLITSEDTNRWLDESLQLSIDISNAQWELTKSAKDTKEAFDDWNVTVEERVAISQALRREQKKGAEVQAELIAADEAELELAESIMEAFENEIIMLNESYDAKQKLAELDLKEALGDLDETADSFNSILDAQISLAESTQDWTTSLEGNAKAIAGVGQSFQKMHVNNLKYQKADYESQQRYAKAFLEARGDEKKEKKAEAKFDKEQATLRSENLNNQLQGYGQLAGAMAQFFEEGSDGAKTFEVAQSSLALVGAVNAVIQAWGSAPFPANLPAVAATSASVVALLGNIGQTLSGGGGGASAPVSVGDVQGTSAGFAFEGMDSTKSLETALKELKSSVDVQNKLFGASGLYGSEFVNDLKVAAGTLISDVTTAWRESFNNPNLLEFNGVLAGFNLETLELKGGATVKQFDNIFQLFGAMSDLGETLPDVGAVARGGNLEDLIEFETAVSEAINSYTSSMLDMAGAMDGYRETWKGIYDEVTQNNKYANIALEEATKQVNELSTRLGVDSFPDLLDQLISKYDIDYSTLQDMYDANDPAKLAEYLSEIFPQGKFSPEEIYNYVDAIESVGDAMSQASSNVESFVDSLKTQQELLQEQADAFNLQVANTQAELMSQFETLKQGTGGLTDAELDYLNTAKNAIDEKESAEEKAREKAQREAKKEEEANLREAKRIEDAKLKEAQKIEDSKRKAAEKFAIEHAKNEARRAKERQKALEEAEKARIKALQDGLKETLRGIESSLGIVGSSIDRLKGATESLRASSLGSTNTLDKFYESMSATIGLSKTGDYAKFSQSLDKTLGLTSVLDDVTAFGSKQEQEFARLAIASQFEDLTGVMETELSVLKQIEANTRTQLLASGAKGFSSGGYTGNIGINQVAGVVHGREYVVNAQTTRDLGLNGQGGLFKQMVQTLNVMQAHLYEINKVSKKQLTVQRDSNIILQEGA